MTKAMAGDMTLINAFNSFIDEHNLREMHRHGPRFTWTNKRDCPIKSNIDRVFMTIEWEQKFPFSILSSLTRIGSGHCPLLLDTGDQLRRPQKQFFFERQWLKQETFMIRVRDRWQSVKDRSPDQAYSLDKWHGLISNLRQMLKGWGNNLRGDFRRKKEDLLVKIKALKAMVGAPTGSE